jgi:hypothetical protein
MNTHRPASKSGAASMNKVDKRIKCMLLAFPRQFSSRWSVLHCMLLCSGTGHKWDDKGNLVAPVTEKSPPYKAARQGKLDFYDLDLRERLMNQHHEHNDSGIIHKETTRVTLGLERVIRQYRAENIDSYTKYHIESPRDGDLGEFEELTVSVDGTAMATIPYEVLNKDWAAVLFETANIVHARLVKNLELNPHKILLKDIPKQWRPLFKLVTEVRNQLMPGRA